MASPADPGEYTAREARGASAAPEDSRRVPPAEADDLYNRAPCGYHSLDEHGVFLRVNDTELEWLGRTREELVGRVRFKDLLSAESRLVFEQQFPILKASGAIENIELTLQREDGTTRSVLLSANTITDEHGTFVASRSMLFDISERKRAQVALRRMNRALRVLGAGNSAVIRAQKESDLLEAICRICVEVGGYRMAWVGFSMQDASRSVWVVAHAGADDGYLENARISWAGDDPQGGGPTGTAIRTGTPQVNQNFLTNSLTRPWLADALARGYQSSIALPLRGADGVIGALTMYATEPDAFDAEEVQLLTELADDLAFGINLMRQRAEHRLAEERVALLAYRDSLTGLPNRMRLMLDLAEAVRDGGNGVSPFALMTLNVSRFGEIQAGIGVQQADALLRQLAVRIRGVLGRDDVLARTGGDEFVVLLRNADAGHARACGRRIEQALVEPFEQAGIPIGVHVRMGAALAPESGLDPEALLLRSGIAARHARHNGLAFALYGGPTESESPRYLALSTGLRKAIDVGEIVLHFQPKVDLAAGCISGAEALIRWQHPRHGLIPPGEFIGVAEQTGLIRPLTYHVLGEALAQVRRWRDEGFHLPVAVNVSVNCLNDLDFPSRVEEMLFRSGVPGRLLQLEITETALMEEPAKAHDLLVRLRRQGILASIDDFGTGYSSLSHVAALPIHALKIDRTFVTKMGKSSRTRIVVAATISLARSLGIGTVAEGVETREQADALLSMGCTEVQGFFFCRPVEGDALRRWIAAFSAATYGFHPAPGAA